MSFKDKYTIDVEDKDKSKILISTDAYAIGELLETLIIRMGRS